MKVKEQSEKADLKLIKNKTKQNKKHKKPKIMASSPIPSWQIEGEKVEAMTNFISWAPKSLQTVTTVMKLKDACSLEEKV